MKGNRTKRINSLLKEVISEVIRKDVKNPHIHPLYTITRVEITPDLQQAKVFVSIIGSDEERQQTLEALESASGFISVNASKKVTMRYFPTLTFKLDTSVDKQMHIEGILQKIQQEKENRDS